MAIRSSLWTCSLADLRKEWENVTDWSEGLEVRAVSEVEHLTLDTNYGLKQHSFIY